MQLNNLVPVDMSELKYSKTFVPSFPETSADSFDAAPPSVGVHHIRCKLIG